MKKGLLFLGCVVGMLGMTSFTLDPKVKICHIPPGNPSNMHTIEVSQSAVAAHLAHGDFVGGGCESITPVPHPVTDIYIP